MNIYRKKTESWMDVYGLAFRTMHRHVPKELKEKNVKLNARDRALAFENAFLVFIM